MAYSSCSCLLNLGLRGAAVAVDAHVLVTVNVPQAVLNHRVDELAVPHAVPLPVNQVGRETHAFHAAGHDHMQPPRRIAGRPA